MRSCPQKDTIADPETFLAGCIAVMMRFGPRVAMAVADPATGLPSRLKWVPTLADINEACDKEATHQATTARYAAMPLPDFSRSFPAVDPCNLFIPVDFRGYREMSHAHEAGIIKAFRKEAHGIHVSVDDYSRIVGIKTR
jgi:hypothetical protein